MTHRRDRGSVLPLVLVIAVVLSVVAIGLAKYATTGLRYADVVEQRADRLAAADGAMRYGIEKLRLNQSPCTTGAGSGGGSTVVFPPTINGATSTVTCRHIGDGTATTQGWAVVVTGGSTPGVFGELSTQGGIAKTFGGPTYVYSPNAIDLQGGTLTIANGDLFFHDDDCPTYTFPNIGGLAFTPSFLRGPICDPAIWSDWFTAPLLNVPTTPAPAPTMDGTCTVFSPGKYTSANFNPAMLGPDNYFKAGEYYFENTNLTIDHGTVIAGFADGRYGDTQSFTASADCKHAQSEDASNGALPGATFYLGGTARIDVDTQGQLEILRRLQGLGSVSIQALDSSGSGYIASSVGLSNPVHNSTPIVSAKAGTDQDLAIHGLVWAPRAYAKFDNVANKANGQVLGGIVIGSIEAQSSNGDGLLIRVEANPARTLLMLTATATKNGESTSINSVAQVEPDTDYLAINSWRVVD